MEHACTGEPLVGAAVRVNGTAQGTVTNLDCSFEVKDLPPDKAYPLEASYIGYVTTEHQLATNTANPKIIIALAGSVCY